MKTTLKIDLSAYDADKLNGMIELGIMSDECRAELERRSETVLTDKRDSTAKKIAVSINKMRGLTPGLYSVNVTENDGEHTVEFDNKSGNKNREKNPNSDATLYGDVENVSIEFGKFQCSEPGGSNAFYKFLHTQKPDANGHYHVPGIENAWVRQSDRFKPLTTAGNKTEMNIPVVACPKFAAAGAKIVIRRENAKKITYITLTKTGRSVEQKPKTK